MNCALAEDADNQCWLLAVGHYRVDPCGKRPVVATRGNSQFKLGSAVDPMLVKAETNI